MKGVYVSQKSELTVAPLTAEERKWVEKLQMVLASCPSRLELVTIGDPSIDVIEKNTGSELADGAAERDGIVLARIAGGPTLHGVSG